MIIEVMLAMIGSVRVADAGALDALRYRLHRYRTIRVSASQRVVLIPPIGSFLVEWDSESVWLHIAGTSRRDLDELVGELTDELTGKPAGFTRIHWADTSGVLVALVTL